MLSGCSRASLGPVGFSDYSLAIAWVQILGVFGKLGLDNASLRYLSEYATKGQAGKLRGFVRETTRASVLACSLIAAFFVATILVRWESIGQTLGSCMLLAAAMIPLLSIRQIQEAGLRGMGRLLESQISNVLWPLMLFALAGTVWATSSTGMSSPQAMLLHLVSIGFASILVHQFFRRSVVRLGHQATLETARSQWTHTASAFLAAELLIVLKSRISVAIAGAMLADPESAGLYSAMERFADVSVLGSQALGLVIAPQFASLFAAGRYADMRRLVVQGQFLCVAFTFPVALGVACFGDYVFLLIGAEYQAGWNVLVALLLSACIGSFSGPAAYVLQMTGRERTMLVITGAMPPRM